MIVKMPGVGQVAGSAVSLDCPACGHKGTFEPVGLDMGQGALHVGLRRCPHPKCRAMVYVVMEDAAIKATYPPRRIDFDSAGIPEKVVGALAEAITCHANECYTAAAMMVRKSLELLCEAQDVKGDNLKARIDALRSKVILPGEFMDALHDLRLLGNDAAHIEAKDYDDVGKDEVGAGIAVAKEVLKAVYQYKNLVSRLAPFKKQKL